MRAVLVVALVAGAGLALQARQGLDWSELADPVQVRWARVLAGTVALMVLGSVARPLLLWLRRPRPRTVDPEPDGPEGEPFPLLLRLLAALIVLAALATVWFVVSSVSGEGPAPPPPPTGRSGEDTPSPLPQPDWPTLLVVAGLLLAAAVAARLHDVRRDRGPDRAAEDADVEPDAAELSSAVVAAEVQLARHGDARAAIVAAYTAMAARIGTGLAGSGRPASAADTPTELLGRATAAGLVGPDAAGTLTGLFREARFSRHPMGEPQRRAAEQALAAVREELAARRA